MTHITIERAKLEQILEALESQHRDRLNYTLAKRSANATCAEFKVNTLSELIESGYMHGIGKQTESAITVAKQALEQPAPVQETVAWSDAKQSELNDWFLSLPTGRQAVLLENKWMLAGAAFLAGKSTPPAPVPLTDLGTLQAIVDEYYAWIRHHAAGHDYDDFLRNRGITASPKKGQP